MGETAFRSEDKIGLLVAVVLHVLLAVVLVMQTFFAPDPFVAPDRVAVSLATEVSLEATAPEPVPESRAAIAPTLSDVPAPEADDAATAVESDASTAAPSRAATRPERRTPFPDTDRIRPDRQPEQPARRSAAPAGGSRIGDDFLSGQGSSTRTDETRAPASEIGARATASLRQAVDRQIKPHWSAPSGADAERLVSYVSWRLNEDGSLANTPSCRTDPASITASNRPQVAAHCERAIRAVRLAAPFDLPVRFYEGWKSIVNWKFDRGT
ncbi:MAG: energy transducer TonB [Erythrobacter sp.]